jgi:hypothetical protein
MTKQAEVKVSTTGAADVADEVTILARNTCAGTQSSNQRPYRPKFNKGVADMKSKNLKKKSSANAQIKLFLSKEIDPERADFPTDEQLASIGTIVDLHDRRAPASIRVISKTLAQFDDDVGIRQVVRWPDGIVALVQGDLSTRKSRRKLLPSAYRTAFSDLLEKTMEDSGLKDPIEIEVKWTK